MKKVLVAPTCLVFLGLLVQSAAFAQLISTGDRRLDSLIVRIDEQATANPEEFIRLLSRTNNVQEAVIRQVRGLFGLSYGDTYMAAALSRISDRPLEVVAEAYHENQGRGWGVMAMNMGIKPGSAEFKELKLNARSSVGHMKTMAKVKKRQQEQERQNERGHGRKTKD